MYIEAVKSISAVALSHLPMLGTVLIELLTGGLKQSQTSEISGEKYIESEHEQRAEE